MATLTTVTPATVAGLDITIPATAGAASQTFVNNGKPGQGIIVKTTGAIVLTVVGRQVISDGSSVPQTVPNRVINIATGKYYFISFASLTPGLFNDANGETTITLDIPANATLMLVQAQ